MATTPALRLRAGDQVRHRGGWFTLAARPAPSLRGSRLHLQFVGGSTRTVDWLASLITKGDQ